MSYNTDAYSVVPYIAGGSTQVNNGCCQWASCCKGVDMCHYIMSGALLLQLSSFKINVRQVVLHFIQLLISDLEVKFLKNTQAHANITCNITFTLIA